MRRLKGAERETENVKEESIDAKCADVLKW
jgi:hypothetical protein